MKQITVSLELFFYSHHGSEGTDGCVTHEVSDEVAADLQTLLDRLEKPLDRGIIEYAIEKGHTLLQDLHNELLSRCHYQFLLHACLEEDQDIDMALEPAFYEDVESDEYEPVADFDADDDEEVELNFDNCRDHYLAWVRSHKDDLYFMAERLDVDIYVRPDYDNYSYKIYKIE